MKRDNYMSNKENEANLAKSSYHTIHGVNKMSDLTAYKPDSAVLIFTQDLDDFFKSGLIFRENNMTTTPITKNHR